MTPRLGSALVAAAALFGGADAYEAIYQRVGKEFYKTYTERWSLPTYDANGQWIQASLPYQLILTNNIDWKVYVETVFNMDTGYSYLRLMHLLDAAIMIDDEIIFEIAFYSQSQVGNIPSAAGQSFGEDFCRCTMSINTSDNRFWTATLDDGYYQCNAAATTTPNICEALDNTYNTNTATVEITTDNDWSIPVGWEDSATDNTNYLTKELWCDPANTTGAVVSYFQCKTLKCYMTRKLGTGDEGKDFSFNPTAGAPDTMMIRPRRASLFFNKVTYQYQFGSAPRTSVPTAGNVARQNIEIPIYAGATNLAVALTVAAVGMAPLF